MPKTVVRHRPHIHNVVGTNRGAGDFKFDIASNTTWMYAVQRIKQAQKMRCLRYLPSAKKSPAKKEVKKKRNNVGEVTLSKGSSSSEEARPHPSTRKPERIREP